MSAVTMEKLVSLAKRRGFVFQSSEIYGGLGSTWDYGPLGVELKRNVKNRWWRDMVTARENVVGMDAAILMNPKVWEASGHVAQFHDLLVDSRKTKKRYRLDHLLEAQKPEAVAALAEQLGHVFSGDPQSTENIVALLGAVAAAGDVDINGVGILDPSNRKIDADWTTPRQFNLMLKTYLGPTEDEGSLTYLRPETAQGIFVNFLNVQTTARMRLPFGIAQIGKAFRNEITTGNFIFRTREFEQMELEFFVPPADTSKWLDYWTEARLNWYLSLGISPGHLRVRPHSADELAHYSAACNDIEYQFPFLQKDDEEGWGELEGIADRGTYDLDRHMEHSGKKLSFMDPGLNEKVLPAVVEASAGVDRTVLALLSDAYHEEEVPTAGSGEPEKRVVLRLSPAMAPITVAVLPLVNKDGMPEIARKLVDDLRGDFAAFHDAGGSIGRRYRRQDEAGTPFCVTVDGQTTEDQTVTVRHRDSMQQERVALEQVKDYLRANMA
ncbi:MAG: glycine--tRNA ligase [Candidatus Marinimicrobia bacterium]|nr:glycine--tRNA ligase [Candidatus Neomarinimicrobiota bacterium]